MHVNRWVLMGLINLFLLVCGFFIPPAAIILMTSPILLRSSPPRDSTRLVRRHRHDQHGDRPDPPAGRPQHLHRQVDRAGRAADEGDLGTVPYVLCMFLAIVILCVFPEIATWLPDQLMAW